MISPVKVALSAFGMSGKLFHAPFLACHPRFELTTVMERSIRQAHFIYPHICSVSTFDEILHDDSIELVVVNTPDDTHVEYVTKALKAGKHVVVEKPVALTSAEARQLFQLAATENRLLTVYQNRRWDGDFLTVQKLFKEGLLGDVVDFQSTISRFKPQIDARKWKESAQHSGGLPFDLGTHLIDQALVLFGLPRAVWADIDRLRPQSEIDDYFHIRLLYDHCKVTLSSSYMAKEPAPRFLIHGTKGSFIKFGNDPQEEALKKGEMPNLRTWGTDHHSFWGILHAEIDGYEVRKPIETHPGDYSDFYDNVYAAIREGKPLNVTPAMSIALIQIIEAAKESSRTGNTIPLSF